MRRLISLGAYEPWIQVLQTITVFSFSENIWFVQTGPCCPSSVLAWPLQPNSLFGKIQAGWSLRRLSFVSDQINLQSGSHYLADLNNEREAKNETYKEVAIQPIQKYQTNTKINGGWSGLIQKCQNLKIYPNYTRNWNQVKVLAGLDNLVLVMWEDDTTIIPKVGKMSTTF